MDANRDYYAALGVLPHAEDVVIRAAYKALAQRYHPDRFSGLPEEANRRMAEINEAYSVLSDPAKRNEYDSFRGSRTQPSDGYFGDAAAIDIPPRYDPLESDWDVASHYYPDLKEIEGQLSKISWRLAYSFRAYLLEAKAFERRSEVARAMERTFLEVYFGTNEEIVKFARALIQRGDRPAVRALNKAVCVLGSAVPPDTVIDKITRDFELLGRLECPAGVPAPIWREEVMRRYAISMEGEWYRWNGERYGSFQAVVDAIRLHGHA